MATAPAMTGFIGLGEQGAPLARNLQSAGYATVVFDSRADAVEVLVANGAQGAGSAAEVSARADIVFVCVANDEQIRNVIEGDQGVVAGMAPGGLIVVNSTVSPAMIARIVDSAGAGGLDVVDAPLSGGPAGAANRTVVYFVGGSEKAINRCWPLLEVSARKIIRAGGSGAGARAKLVHQLILCGNILAARDGWELGRRAGLDQQVILEVIKGGAAQSLIAERLPGISWSRHAAELFQKDLGLCLELSAQMDLVLPSARFLEQIIETITDPE